MRSNDKKYLLKIKGLRKYGLDKLDLSIAKGDRVAIVGPSGAGKSVLIECILGLIEPEDGVIDLLGRRVERGNPLPEGVGVAFQEAGLLDGRSVVNNVHLGASGEEEKSKVRELLDALDLKQVELQQTTTVLSGGQRKRIALARALIGSPDLLVLDEPTSGLDPATIDRTTEVLDRRISGDQGLVVVTHHYDFALRLCDRVLLLSGGRLEEITPSSDGSKTATLVARLRDADDQIGNSSVEQPPPSGFWSNLWRYSIRSVPLTVVLMAMIGVMLVAQTSGVGPTDISPYLPAIVVNTVFRELAPLVVGLLLAGRIGASIASKISAMSYTSQLDVMRVHGISRWRHLILPDTGAAMGVFPINILIGAGTALTAGAWIVQLPWSGVNISTLRFWSLSLQVLDTTLIIGNVIKGLAMGGAVGLMSYFISARRISTASRLGTLVTTAVFAGSVVVILLDILISLVLYT